LPHSCTELRILIINSWRSEDADTLIMMGLLLNRPPVTWLISGEGRWTA